MPATAPTVTCTGVDMKLRIGELHASEVAEFHETDEHGSDDSTAVAVNSLGLFVGKKPLVLSVSVHSVTRVRQM